MKPVNELNCSAFRDSELIATGKMVDVALAAKAQLEKHPKSQVMVFDDSTGQFVEFDYRGTEEKFLERLKIQVGGGAEQLQVGATTPDDKPGPGRPKLGVVSREIGLLPRHWEWLSHQPGGASGTLRRLVEDAQKKTAGKDELRRIQDAAYRFMSTMAGDAPGYEEALRAFYAKDWSRFKKQMSDWPKDVRTHTLKLVKALI